MYEPLTRLVDKGTTGYLCPILVRFSVNLSICKMTKNAVSHSDHIRRSMVKLLHCATWLNSLVFSLAWVCSSTQLLAVDAHFHRRTPSTIFEQLSISLFYCFLSKFCPLFHFYVWDRKKYLHFYELENWNNMLDSLF